MPSCRLNTEVYLSLYSQSEFCFHGWVVPVCHIKVHKTERSLTWGCVHRCYWPVYPLAMPDYPHGAGLQSVVGQQQIGIEWMHRWTTYLHMIFEEKHLLDLFWCLCLWQPDSKCVMMDTGHRCGMPCAVCATWFGFIYHENYKSVALYCMFTPLLWCFCTLLVSNKQNDQ